MQIYFENAENKLTVRLNGEIDHHSTLDIRDKIDTAVREAVPAELVLDFAGVSFMDSSGIGLVMGRYRTMQELGGRVQVINPSSGIKRVMKFAGLDKLVVL